MSIRASDATSPRQWVPLTNYTFVKFSFPNGQKLALDTYSESLDFSETILWAFIDYEGDLAINRISTPPGTAGACVIVTAQQGRRAAGRARSLTAGEVHGSFANQQTNMIPRETYSARKALDQNLTSEVAHGFQGGAELYAPKYDSCSEV